MTRKVLLRWCHSPLSEIFRGIYAASSRNRFGSTLWYIVENKTALTKNKTMENIPTLAGTKFRFLSFFLLAMTFFEAVENKKFESFQSRSKSRVSIVNSFIMLFQFSHQSTFSSINFLGAVAPLGLAMSLSRSVSIFKIWSLNCQFKTIKDLGFRI